MSAEPSKRRERETKLVELFHGAPIAQSTGMRLHYNEAGQAIFEMPYNLHYDHALKGIHGGIIAMMIDNAGWFTVAPHFNHWIATVEFSTRLLEPVQKEDLISIGEIVRLGKTLAVCRMEVRTAAKRLIATGSGTFMVTTVALE
jgi:uncharacterized protein (TIGR00369 family)